MDDGFLNTLRLTFKIEASEHLQVMATGLLALEKSPSHESKRGVIETIFRAAHSLKGAARAVDLVNVESICQVLEDNFAAWKRGDVVPTSDGIDLALRELDSIQELLLQVETGIINPALTSDLPPPVNAVQPAVNSVDQTRPRDSSFSQEIHQEMSFGQPPQLELASVHARSTRPDPVLTGGEIKSRSGDDTVRISIAKLDARLVEAEEMLTVKLTIDQRAIELRELGNRFETWRHAWISIESDVRELRRTADRDGNAQKSDDTLRMDRIMEFLHWNRDHIRQLEDLVTSMTNTAELDRHEVGKKVHDLLEDSKRLLLLPFSTLTAWCPRLVRDLCREQGKEAELVIRGDQVQMDKRILEAMKDPVMHLLRNCIDHGVELSHRRKEQGKPQTATITISASTVNGSKVELLVSDDGAGIDTERIKASAVEHGLISADEAGRLTVEEAHELIFRDRVTSRETVTRMSGRGLGMAIVREWVEKLGGKVGVESRPGMGSAFRIVLPMMLATFRGIQIEAAGQTFVVPTSLVERVVKIKTADIQTVEGKQIVTLSGRSVSMVSLSDVLGLRPRAGSPIHEGGALSSILMVLGSGDNRIAFRIEAVLDEHEVLVKPLTKPLVRVRNIAGATVLGSGKVVPILNVTDLLKSARRSSASTSRVANDSPQKQIKSILVAEDSITSRMLLRSILESAGYRVTTAVDGMDAFVLLRGEKFDLLVSDVEMPRLDGFGLTSKVRAEKSLAGIPVILVTARETAEDKERGFDAGANAYIVKSKLDNSNLLEAIERLV